MKFKVFLSSSLQWFFNTPLRALDQAYRATKMIESIENQHFQGKKVSLTSSNSESNYLQSEVERCLQIAKVRLAEFKSSRFFLGLVKFKNNQKEANIILSKILFIDSYLAKYTNIKLETKPQIVFPEENTTLAQPNSKIVNNSPKFIAVNGQVNNSNSNIETVSDKTSVLPRSIWRTVDRIKEGINPNSEDAEEKVLKSWRTSRYKTAISVKFFLILIIVPLLTHQLSKTFLHIPVVDDFLFKNSSEQLEFLNTDLEEEAFFELEHYEHKLHFQHLIGTLPHLSSEELEEKLEEKAQELQEEYRNIGKNAIKNIYADIASLIAFCVIIYISKDEIVVVKSFIDEIIYGLSDSAKAFLIILLTDIFVGFHSPHGWEVILEGVAHHFGLPENREFDFLFIATFPVILDTVLKYWIFRYLNRISPSAVATYRNMNE